MDEWIDFYDSAHSIYVSARHRDVHFETIGREIAELVGTSDATVIDYSCGDALSADLVAAACGHLILAEPAPGVRARLAERFKNNARIDVLSLEQLAALQPQSVDLVVINSVAQYMAPEALDAALVLLRGLLKPTGRLILGDVVRPDTGPITDASALLRFAAAHGFLKDAVVGLARTALSGYRKTRDRLGFSQYDEATMVGKLSRAGLHATRAAHNIGHNQARMTFVATPANPIAATVRVNQS